MSIFFYKAADVSGKVIKGTLDAPDERGAAARLQEMGYIPMRIYLTGEKKGSLEVNLGQSLANVFIRVSTRDVMRFTQDLSALLKAGLPVDRALSVLMGAAENKKFRNIVGEILKAVQGGSDLSTALAQHPAAFSDFYINMVRAGEAGGVLEAVLDRLGEFLETSQELRDYIKSALVYPIFLVCVGGISIIILMVFVIPRFSVIFEDMGASLPIYTRILLEVCALLKGYGWAFVLAGASAWFLFRHYARTPSGRARIDRYKIRGPVVGNMVKQIEAARFARTLGTLVKSGVPILQSLDLVKSTIANTLVSREMARVRDRVKEGDQLSRPLEEARIFPALAVQMITVGEESGRLDEMLLRVAETYEKIVRNMVKRFVSLLEPLLILIMGVVVGFIIISMLMAIFSMNDIPF
jgi:general secretion pathway protein F